MKDNSYDEIRTNALLAYALSVQFERELEKFPDDETLAVEYAPSEQLNKKLLAIAKKHTDRTRTRSVRSAFFRIAAIICVALVVSAAALLSVEASRVYIFNIIAQWHEKSQTVDFGNGSAQSEIIYPAYVPDGYVITAEYAVMNKYYIEYSNTEGSVIYFEQMPIDAAGGDSFNSEEIGYTEIEIAGTTVYCYSSDDGRNNIAMFVKRSIVFNLAGNLPLAELLNMAGSLIE